ncbi:MAG TPA: hypothetical protein VMC42_09690 [Methanoregulaceae archaeon]|nr:hypothetical protein [Methanoregulaceae archaeon]
MAYSEDGQCSLVCRENSGSSVHGGTKNEIPGKKKPPGGKRDSGEKASRFRAELFD